MVKAKFPTSPEKTIQILSTFFLCPLRTKEKCAQNLNCFFLAQLGTQLLRSVHKTKDVYFFKMYKRYYYHILIFLLASDLVKSLRSFHSRVQSSLAQIMPRNSVQCPIVTICGVPGLSNRAKWPFPLPLLHKSKSERSLKFYSKARVNKKGGEMLIFECLLSK